MKLINTSISSFESLRTNNNVYIDKTGYLYNMIRVGDAMYFASRPRRFGKTLTISTLEAIFSGRKELFDGLYISRTDYSWMKYPVIHIDFGNCQCKTKSDIEHWLCFKLDKIASLYNINFPDDYRYYERLEVLITALAGINKVVVLIDEYDKPLSSNYKNPEVEEIRDVIRGFFEVLKASYDYLHFVFITGVTKYAKVSIFSSMNNLNDISMSDEYAALFGYTQQEIEENFTEYIDKGADFLSMTKDEYLLQIKQEYDGYRFSDEEIFVYNPVSVGKFFENGGKKFVNYWMTTGGNAYLICDIAKRVNFNVVSDLSEPMKTDLMCNYDIVEMAKTNAGSSLLKSLMYQSGYLTIKKYDSETMEYFLDFPNGEVRKTFVPKLLDAYLGNGAEQRFSAYSLLPKFVHGKIEEVMETIKSIYASVPNVGADKLNEYSYALGFCCMMLSVGAEIDSEVNTNKGRIDSVLFAGNNLYIIEFKVDQSADEAIKQIKDRGYVEKYKVYNGQYKIHLVGINFSERERNISEYKEVEEKL